MTTFTRAAKRQAEREKKPRVGRYIPQVSMKYMKLKNKEFLDQEKLSTNLKSE